MPWSAVIRQKSAGRIAASISRQGAVEGLEAGGEAGDVAAMAPFGVEIDQVDEDKPPSGVSLQRLDEQVDVAVVAFALALAPGVAMGEDVADLADRDDRAPAPAPRAARILPSGGGMAKSLRFGVRAKSLGARPNERARDHPADVQRIAQAPRDPAEIVEPLEPESLLVRGDLEHRIGRGVADRLAASGDAPRRAPR